MTDSPSNASSGDDLSALAIGKLSRVLGAERGLRIFDATLAAANMSRVQTPDELYRFAQQLSLMGGIEAAVAGLLSVSAVIRGASAEPTKNG